MARALKVYCTPIGFHDAYVAATSQKAALDAWGTDKNLFARGAAQVVTDPKLTKEPLATPGKVIKRTRGDLSDHLAAATSLEPQRRAEPSNDKKAKADPAPKRKPRPNPKPPPSRAAVAKAEAALAAHEAEVEQQLADLRDRERALRDEREQLQKRRTAGAARLETALAKARERHDAAIERWTREG